MTAPSSVPQPAPNSSLPVEKQALLAIAILASGLLIDAAYCAFMHFCHINVSLFIASSERFNDFTNWRQFPVVPTPAYFAVPPFLILIMSIWSRIAIFIGQHFALALYSLSWVLLLIYAVFSLLRDAIPSAIKCWLLSFFLVAFSYSTLFCLNRGNIAGAVIAMFALGLHFYQKRRFTLSVLMVACAVNIKIIPAVFLLLPLAQHRWRLLAYYLAVIAAIFYTSIMLEDRFFFADYDLQHFKDGMVSYYNDYVIGNGGFPWGASLFGALKDVIFYPHAPEKYSEAVVAALPVYNVIAMLMTAMIGLIIYIRKPPLLQTSILLVAWLLLTPHVMAEYYLGFLLIPLALSIRARATLYTVMLSIALLPKVFFWPDLVSTGSILSPCIIFLLLLLCVIQLYRKPHAYAVMEPI